MVKVNALQTVTKALDRVRVVKSEHGRIPRLEAYEAILNSDLIDRRSGITLPDESTVGLELALRVKR